MSREPNFSERLVTAVVQDHTTGDVLMVAHMNEESWKRTADTGLATFWSRSRNRIWQKGEESGNIMRVEEVHVDCDGDAVVLRVTPAGPACHLGTRTCFDEP